MNQPVFPGQNGHKSAEVDDAGNRTLVDLSHFCLSGNGHNHVHRFIAGFFGDTKHLDGAIILNVYGCP